MFEFNRSDLERARKKAQRREEFEEKKARLKWWFYNNKETIMVCAPVILGAAAKGVNALNRGIKVKQERDLKELYCYDPSLGHYWKLRRKLNNSDWVKIDSRRRNGERMADILSDLKVLK